VGLIIHPYLEPRLKEEQSYTSAPPLGLHGLFWDKIHLLTLLNWSFRQKVLRVARSSNGLKEIKSPIDSQKY
jgi:hypothetical protein